MEVHSHSRLVAQDETRSLPKSLRGNRTIDSTRAFTLTFESRVNPTPPGTTVPHMKGVHL